MDPGWSRAYPGQMEQSISRHPVPLARGVLEAPRHILVEQETAAGQRVRRRTGRRQVARFLPVEGLEARARVADRPSLRLPRRKRDVGSEQIYQLVGRGRVARPEARGRVRRQRGEKLDGPEASQLVAGLIGLGDQRREGWPEPRRLEGDDPLTPERAVVHAIRLVSNAGYADTGDRREPELAHRCEPARVDPRVGARE